MNLAQLNSATKYPPILTYHALGEKGRLTEEVLVFFPDWSSVEVTEKLDGTNARIILLPEGDFILGSREDLLTAKGDRIPNPALGIVDALRPVADRVCELPLVPGGSVVVLYGEVFGKGVGPNHKQYSTTATGFRLFDAIALPAAQVQALEAMPVDRIASWREHGGQAFLNALELLNLSAHTGIPLTQRIATTALPTDIQGVHDWLVHTIPTSHATLDDSGGGRPEGVVVRTANRQRIAKIRFEDYQRTLRAAKS